MKLSEACDSFLTYLVTEKGDSQATIRSYQIDLESFCKMFDNMEVSEINVETINNYILSLFEQGYSRNSLIKKAEVARYFCKYLKSLDLLNINITDIEVPKNIKRLPHYLSDDEITRLLQTIRDNDDILFYLVVAIAISSGLRVSELVDLKMTDMNLIDGYLKITGKGNKDRIIPLNQDLITKINEYLETYKKGIKKNKKFFFVHNNGKLLSRQFIYLKLKEYANKSGITKRISPHCLRHTYATLLLNNGAKLKEVQMLLGHSKIETTEIYTHVAKKKVKEKYDEYMRR